jgi:hypothetical protein
MLLKIRWPQHGVTGRGRIVCKLAPTTYDPLEDTLDELMRSSWSNSKTGSGANKDRASLDVVKFFLGY